uniref:Uncharacterized protein n=1 Tax=Anguilla anguilla TaxID=7936 RepID=A0A0E9WJ78_ANGAN
MGLKNKKKRLRKTTGREHGPMACFTITSQKSHHLARGLGTSMLAQLDTGVALESDQLFPSTSQCGNGDKRSGQYRVYRSLS